MSVSTAHCAITISTDCALLLTIEYVDVGHVTTLANDIAVPWLVMAQLHLILVLQQNMMLVRCHRYVSHWLMYATIMSELTAMKHNDDVLPSLRALLTITSWFNQ